MAAMDIESPPKHCRRVQVRVGVAGGVPNAIEAKPIIRITLILAGIGYWTGVSGSRQLLANTALGIYNAHGGREGGVGASVSMGMHGMWTSRPRHDRGELSA